MDNHIVGTAGITNNITFGYDANGNPTTANGRSYTYNHFNKPASVMAGSVTTSYEYGPNYERLTKTQGSNITTYIGGLYEKVDTSTGTEHRYFISVGDRLVAQISRVGAGTPTTYYVHTDLLGSVNAMTNSSGAIVQGSINYAEYGDPKQGSWGTAFAKSTRGYTGHEMDAESSLINMNARLYDPVIGRFVSADTVIPNIYNPQSLNRYSYVVNNPFRYVDPTGHALVGCWDGTCTFDNGGDSNASTTVYNQATGAFFHTGNDGGYSVTTGSGVFVESGSSALGYNSSRLWTNCVASECGSASESTWKVIDPNNPGLYGRALWYDDQTGFSYWKITSAVAHAGDGAWISVNGMLNNPEKATWLMAWHTHAEDPTMTRDTLLYSPDNGFWGGLGEAITAKNGHNTPTSELIAQELRYGYEQGITHNWMTHSRGAPEFNQGAATAGVPLSYNHVWYHGGADNHADTNDLAAATGFHVMSFRDSPIDAVPQIAGRNGNIATMIGSVPMLICVVACSPENSPHTPPYMYGGQYPQRYDAR